MSLVVSARILNSLSPKRWASWVVERLATSPLTSGVINLAVLLGELFDLRLLVGRQWRRWHDWTSVPG